jgi:hypothetical protein
MKTMLMFIWQLPQNIVGLLMFVYFKIRGIKPVPFRNAHFKYYVVDDLPFNAGGVSLGQFKFVYLITYTEQGRPTKVIAWPLISATALHEFGHELQSRILGWFYLPVAGFMMLYSILFQRKRLYHGRTFEAWADKLAQPFYILF